MNTKMFYFKYFIDEEVIPRYKREDKYFENYESENCEIIEYSIGEKKPPPLFANYKDDEKQRPL